jgi:hypothetical protein
VFTFSMIQKPTKIDCKVYAFEGKCFDVVIEGWRLDHNNNQVQAVTLKFTDLSESDLVMLKDTVCTAIQEAFLKRGGETK